MIWVEKINIATGFILVAIGIITFADGVYPMGFSWLIFGSMYLAMGSYRPDMHDQFEKKAILVRKTFAVVGFIATIVLLFYTLLSL